MRISKAKTLLIGVMAMIAACAPSDNDYSSWQAIPQEGWRYAEALTFEPVHADSIMRGNLTLGLRHDDRYAYSNVWLEVAYTDHDREQVDTLNIVLADKYGKWRGIGNATDFQVVDTIARGIVHASRTPVRVRHIMRVDTLQGIDLVGIEFHP
ncbi:MAG: gliding motility lipoprotein GldH [Bacteroidales bacterium]|nr:gliding motility lipoprotein GldH [Bacteroidales bacterium]